MTNLFMKFHAILPRLFEEWLIIYEQYTLLIQEHCLSDVAKKEFENKLGTKNMFSQLKRVL